MASYRETRKENILEIVAKLNRVKNYPYHLSNEYNYYSV